MTEEKPDSAVGRLMDRLRLFRAGSYRFWAQLRLNVGAEAGRHAERARRNGKGRSRAAQRRRSQRVPTEKCVRCHGQGSYRSYDTTSGVNPLGIKCWQSCRCWKCGGTGRTVVL